ncbi:hypothetical protein ACFQ07_33475 [Actinomadura adrarensis]|uniref:Uncharacterized protein n=1 Tax=Actinomadura adrarensis TaxID=1819600 RepID=A0ABW3CUY6_9ACTN
MSITFTTTLGGPELNLNNGNAAEVLALLGFTTEDMWGCEAPAEDFLGRILMARALLDVSTDDEHGRPAYTDNGESLRGLFGDGFQAEVIHGGRWPGYFADRLASLQEIAEWAYSHHADVRWA